MSSVHGVEHVGYERLERLVEGLNPRRHSVKDRVATIAAVALEDFDAWSASAKSKISAVIGRHQHPRVFMTISRAQGVSPSPFVQRCMAVDVGEETAPCRRRALAM